MRRPWRSRTSTPDGPCPLDCQGRAAGERPDRRPAALGDGLHPGRVHFLVFHAGCAAGDVRALVAGRGLLDGGLVSAVQHVRPRALRLAVAPRAPGRAAAQPPCRRSSALPGPPLCAFGLASCMLLRSVPARVRADIWRGSSASAGASWPPISSCRVAIIWGLGSRLGTEIFPTIDTGQFRLRMRAPDGTDIDRTEQIVLKALEVIEHAAGADNVEMTPGLPGHDSLHLPDQHRLSMDAGAGGGGDVGGLEEGERHPRRAIQRGAPRKTRAGAARRAVSLSNRPTSSTR